jgi:hypothetical protein
LSVYDELAERMPKPYSKTLGRCSFPAADREYTRKYDAGCCIDLLENIDEARFLKASIPCLPPTTVFEGPSHTKASLERSRHVYHAKIFCSATSNVDHISFIFITCSDFID